MIKLNTSDTVAAFDFDGTLTYRDSLLPFLFFSSGIYLTLFKLMTLVPLFIQYVFGFQSRQETKEKVLTKFFKGKSLRDIRAIGQLYAEGSLNKQLRPQALERIKWHLNQGHRCILISASIDAYLHPWARLNGFHDTITSELDVDTQGNVTGKLKGKNCWGEEKSRRLKELLSPQTEYLLYAYGDSKGDGQLLTMADYSYYKCLG